LNTSLLRAVVELQLVAVVGLVVLEPALDLALQQALFTLLLLVPVVLVQIHIETTLLKEILPYSLLSHPLVVAVVVTQTDLLLAVLAVLVVAVTDLLRAAREIRLQ
jgi:hypothetical protein